MDGRTAPGSPVSGTKSRIMKNVIIHLVSLTLLSLMHLPEAVNGNINGNPRTTRTQGRTFGRHPNGGLISFDADDGKFRIDWAITVPFISIPLDRKVGENGEISPLLQLNSRGLGMVGLMATLFGIIMPLFLKKHPQNNYRSENEGQWSQIGSAVSDIIFGNNYVTPCMQRAVCSMVSVASSADNQTSTDKIIDGLSGHRWFKDIVNGTIIQDAVDAGRRDINDCAYIYNDCPINPLLLKTIMNEFGIV